MKARSTEAWETLKIEAPEDNKMNNDVSYQPESAVETMCNCILHYWVLAEGWQAQYQAQSSSPKVYSLESGSIAFFHYVTHNVLSDR